MGSYLYSPEDSMCVYAVLRAAAVYHRGAGVTVITGCVAANTDRETDRFITCCCCGL